MPLKCGPELSTKCCLQLACSAWPASDGPKPEPRSFPDPAVSIPFARCRVVSSPFRIKATIRPTKVRERGERARECVCSFGGRGGRITPKRVPYTLYCFTLHLSLSFLLHCSGNVVIVGCARALISYLLIATDYLLLTHLGRGDLLTHATPPTCRCRRMACRMSRYTSSCASRRRASSSSYSSARSAPG